MPRLRPGPAHGASTSQPEAALLAEGVAADGRHGRAPTSLADALERMWEAEDTLRAIGAGEVDAFVVSGGGADAGVFTLATADRPYRMFVENMREGAATVSATGLVLYVNRRLAEILSHPIEGIVGSQLTAILASGTPIDMEDLRGPAGLGTTVELELVAANGDLVPVLVGSSPLEVDGNDLLCLTFADLTAQKVQERERTPERGAGSTHG